MQKLFLINLKHLYFYIKLNVKNENWQKYNLKMFLKIYPKNNLSFIY